MRYTVITASKSKALGNGLSYETKKELPPGSVVSVPLQKQLVEGIVFEVLREDMKSDFDLKQIHSLLEEKPLLLESHLQTIRWIAHHYCCTLKQALSLFLPQSPWHTLSPCITQYSLIGTEAPKGAKQKLIFEFLQNKGWLDEKDILNAGCTKENIRSAVKSGLLASRSIEQMAPIRQINAVLTNLPILTENQETAYLQIRSEKRPSLLFGITGSGKTEIYAQMIADAVGEQKQAILLVPEILLTEHSIDRFKKLLPPESIAIVHSRLTPSQKRKVWQQIRNGEISLVVGSRSALFAPLPNLGLVILDEEHEWTYKNEQTPRYHARDTAETLCRYSSAKLVLGSATPSVESWYKAKKGDYHLARLPSRYLDQSLPDVKIVDLAECRFGKDYPFSPTLIEAIQSRLDKKEQIVLLLNHRGVASALLCLECRRRITSPDSAMPFTVHTQNGKPYLMDHTSGRIADVPTECPSCKSVNLLPIGAGTQKVEFILKKLFPSAALFRADSDTLESPEDMRDILSKMRNREADILFGTQSVAKGLDLPGVTLAAVLIADIGLSLPDFRSGERIFDLLTQLTGRSGRATAGEVIIQTFRPDSREVKEASLHQTEKFLDEELAIRTHLKYPPLSHMARLIYRGPDARTSAEITYKKLLKEAGENMKISFSPTLFGGNSVWHIILRGEHVHAFLQKKDLMNAVIDIDPQECV